MIDAYSVKPIDAESMRAALEGKGYRVLVARDGNAGLTVAEKLEVARQLVRLNVDGQSVDSCLMMAYQADGAAVETIEGMVDGALHPLQESFIDHGGVQCGICIPGMILAAKALVDQHPEASADEVKAGLAGNLCRCTGYTKIFDAVRLAASR